MTKVRVLKEFSYGGEDYEKNDTADVPESIAKKLENKGYAAEIVGDEEPAIESLQLKGEGGINVESMLPGGDFISHEDVEEGDVVEILDTGETDDSFDQERLVLPVKLNEEEMQVSLGPENIERMSEAFGMNTQNWIGKGMKVALIKKYKGLGKKGIVWKPIKEW